MAYEIITFGNGEILKGVFDAIVMCLNPTTGTLYTPLIRIGMIFGVLWAAIFSIWGDFVRVWGRAIIPFVFIPPLLFVPSSTVFIKDVVSNYREKVDNVPYGLAYMAHLISTLGYHMTKEVDRVFASVEDLQYHKSGFLMASNLIQQAKTFRITNEDVAENMRQFVTQCVAMEAMLGKKYTVEDLRTSSDIWGLVSQSPSPIRSFLWRQPHKKGEGGSPPEVISCSRGVIKFNLIWGNELERAKTLFGTKFFGTKDPVKGRNELLKYLPLSYEFLSGLSKSADQIMKQQMMIHSVVDGIEQKSVALGNAPNFAARRAYLQQRSTYETLGAMASETLMTMKAVLEAVAYTSFIFIVPLAVLPFGVKILLSWVQTLLWLQMWAPLYAVLNFIMSTAARTKSMGMVSMSNPDGVTIASSVGLSNLNADMSAMAGYLAMSVPFLAIALVKGVGSFVHMASHLGNVSQGAASQAAGEATTGNYSFGNIHDGNQQIANTSMFSQSRAASYRAGAFQFVDGRTDMTTMADGSQVANVSTPNVPVTLNKSETQSAQLSDMATKAAQSASNLTQSSSESFSDSYNKMIKLSKSLSESESAGDSVSQGMNAEYARSVHKGRQVMEDFADQNQIGVDKAANIFAESSVGCNFILKGAVGGKTSLNATDQSLVQKANKFIKDNGYQNVFKDAAQASKNLSHSLTNENGKSVAEDVSASYETGVNQRSEASKSFSKSESWSRQATEIKLNASAVNANYSQQVMEYIAEQESGDGGKIGIHGAANMMASNLPKAMEYARQYDENIGRPHTDTSSPDEVRKSYNEDTSHLQYKTGMGKMDEVRTQASQAHFKGGDAGALRKNVKNQLDSCENTISESIGDIDKNGSVIKEKVTSQEGTSVHANLARKGGREIKKGLEELKEYDDELTRKMYDRMSQQK